MNRKLRIGSNSARARWAALGAAVAVTAGAGGLGIAGAASPAGGATYVPIVPCRLADTRPATNVGPRDTPLGADTTVTYDGWGDVDGGCALPEGTTALQLNVTAVGATQLTNLRLYPTGAALPSTSNLNPAPGQPPTPNAVTVSLDATGRFDVFNRFGELDVIVDVAGYYTDHEHDDRYYTKAEADAALAAAIDGIGDGPDIDAYTKAEADAALAAATSGKADAADVYTKAQTDAAIAAATAPETHTITLGPEAFQPFNGAVTVARGGNGVWVTDAGGQAIVSLRAPVVLPAGSTITGLTYHYVDDDASGVSIGLIRNLINAASDVVVSGTSTSTSGPNASPQSTAISGLDIDVTQTGALSIDATGGGAAWQTAGNALAVKGVVVTYTLPG